MASERARLIVPVSWNVTHEIRISPAALSLGFRRPGEVIRSQVLLASDEEPFRVLLVECDDKSVRLSEAPSPLPSVCHVLLEFRDKSTLPLAPGGPN